MTCNRDVFPCSYGSCALYPVLFQQTYMPRSKSIGHDRTLWASRKCRKNDDQREITQRQNEVELWFFGIAFHINAKKHKCQVSSKSD